jgi:hypothetical protein
LNLVTQGLKGIESEPEKMLDCVYTTGLARAIIIFLEQHYSPPRASASRRLKNRLDGNRCTDDAAGTLQLSNADHNRFIPRFGCEGVEADIAG